MSFKPYTLDYDATPVQLAAIRTHLGIPVYQQSGKLSNDDGVIEWRITPAGFQVTVDELHGFLVSRLPESVIRTKIAEQVGLSS